MPTFTVAGQLVTLKAKNVATALQEVAPELIQKHAVEVDGRLYPVVQALEAASGVARDQSRSSTARQVFTALGMRLVEVAPSASRSRRTEAGINAAINPSVTSTSFARAAPVAADASGATPWARMHVQPGHPVAQVDTSKVPTAPGVYAFYRDGQPVYVGRAIASGGLQRRLKTQHLKTVNDLSWSAFRRNVAERLGIAPSTVTKRRPPQLTEAQVASINEWVAACELRWIACATESEATQLEIDLKHERKPPLTKR